jgi:hypothetical protein
MPSGAISAVETQEQEKLIEAVRRAYGRSLDRYLRGQDLNGYIEIVEESWLDGDLSWRGSRA